MCAPQSANAAIIGSVLLIPSAVDVYHINTPDVKFQPSRMTQVRPVLRSGVGDGLFVLPQCDFVHIQGFHTALTHRSNMEADRVVNLVPRLVKGIRIASGLRPEQFSKQARDVLLALETIPVNGEIPQLQAHQICLKCVTIYTAAKNFGEL
jgi:hypothetical protein